MRSFTSASFGSAFLGTAAAAVSAALCFARATQLVYRMVVSTHHSTNIYTQPVRLGLKRSYTIVDYYCWLIWYERKILFWLKIYDRLRPNEQTDCHFVIVITVFSSRDN